MVLPRDCTSLFVVCCLLAALVMQPSRASASAVKASYNGSSSAVLQHMRPWLEQLDGPLLDVGCGSGYKLMRLRGLVGEGVEMHGADTNPLYLEQGQWAETVRTSFHLVNESRLPFDDGKFAAITASAMLHHIPLPAFESFLRELARVLTPGGIFLIEEGICAGTMQQAMEPLWDETRGTHEAYLGVLAHLSALGFTMVEQRRFMETFRYASHSVLVDDILTTNPHLSKLPDLRDRIAQVGEAFLRVGQVLNIDSPMYALQMPKRFEVWRKHTVTDNAITKPSIEVDPIGIPPPFAAPIKLRGHPFTAGSHSESMPLVVPNPTTMFPLLLRAQPNRTVTEYAVAAKELLSTRLHEVGAILIRGLPYADVADFEAFLSALGHKPQPYTLGTTERSRVGSIVWTVAEDAPGHTSEPHQEQAYRHDRYPEMLTFMVRRANGVHDGGQTLLADMRKVTTQVDAGILAGLKQLGLTYIRVLQNGTISDAANRQGWPKAAPADVASMGRRKQPWQAHLGTTRAEAEAWMKANGYNWAWLEGDTLQMWQTVHNVTRLHPSTGEEVFFAQPSVHHRSFHEAHPGFLATNAFPTPAERQQLPVHCTYGNGMPLSEHTLQHIRATLYQNSVALDLDQGDVLVVDNFLVGHGRMPMKVGRSREMFAAFGNNVFTKQDCINRL